MNLFEISKDNGLPILDPVAYQLRPIKKLITRDKTKDKRIAKAEITYIWFYADYKSDFSSEINEVKKVEEIIKLVDLPADWKPDKYVISAIEFYKHITITPTTTLLINTKKTIKKLSKFLDDIDYAETDAQGKLIYDIKKVVDTTNQIPKLIATLRDIEDKVKEEQGAVEVEIRGGKEIAVWEDGIDVI